MSDNKVEINLGTVVSNYKKMLDIKDAIIEQKDEQIKLLIDRCQLYEKYIDSIDVNKRIKIDPVAEVFKES